MKKKNPKIEMLGVVVVFALLLIGVISTAYQAAHGGLS